MAGAPILKITDGTTTVNLLNSAGVILRDWNPSHPGLRETWRQSPFSHGRNLVMAPYDNIVDTFNVTITSLGGQDAIITETQDLDRLLTQAVAYWKTNWNVKQVYLVARGPDETETRYAVIKSYRLPTDGNPYSQSFYNCIRRPGHNVSLIIEHGLWQADEPGTDTGIAIETLQEWNGHDYGREYDNGLIAGEPVDEHYVQNHQAFANITHIYWWSNASGWSGNLIQWPMPGAPFALFDPLGIANGDFVIFGIDATVAANSGPFWSLIFDISTAATYSSVGVPPTMDWQYSTAAGPTYTSFGTNITDETEGDCAVDQPFRVTGVNGVFWGTETTKTPINWIPIADGPAATTAYWIRCIATVPGGETITVPFQNNSRNVYSVRWPRVDIAGDDVGGDIPALLRVKIHGQSECDESASPWAVGPPNRVFMALRSLSRGEDFTPYLNWSDYQIPAGYLISAIGLGAFATQVMSPTGRVITYNTAGNQAEAPFARMRLSYDQAMQYEGDFHCYVRYASEGGLVGGGTAVTRLRVQFTSGSPGGSITFFTKKVTLLPIYGLSFAGEYLWFLADMGRVRLPVGGEGDPNDGPRLHITLHAENIQVTAPATVLFDFIDIILMPVDEWAGVFEDPMADWMTEGQPMAYSRYLQPESTRQAKYPIRVPLRREDNDVIWSNYIPYTAGEAILQTNTDQRLWFLHEHSYNPATDWSRTAAISLATSIRVYRVQRYLSQRGAR